ncbi:Heat-inducible transcription repressor HrcA [Candidatus Nanopelagicaceae bacterium]|jgi:transcriptional regulator of heat shock response
MSSRRLEILRAIVDEYVATQEPVGSKAIAERHGLGISPATIRNEMAVLEDEGLITQPHTSAGRIPTDLGYRVFVDKLATVKPLSPAERRAIETFLDEANNLEQLMRRSAKLLADITKQVAVITYPIIGESTGSEKMAISGTANLARSGEDLGLTLSPILEALEEQVVLMRLLDEANSTVHVRIGREQIETNLQTTSLVSVGYGANSAQLGAVGVLGPTRMDYAGSIAAVDAVARYVGRFLIEGA